MICSFGCALLWTRVYAIVQGISRDGFAQFVGLFCQRRTRLYHFLRVVSI